MLTPKLISDSDTHNRKWYECPYCFDLFLADPYQVNRGAYKSCGCRKQTPVSRSTEEKTRWEWLRRELERASVKNVPPLLLKLVKPRSVAFRWNPECNLDACANFLKDTSPKPPNTTQSWKDPLGPISPENFEWKPIHGSKSSRTDPAPDTT
jgi:hypothetical protein